MVQSWYLTGWLALVLLVSGCALFDELPPQPPISNVAPETYLSISSESVIYAKLDSIVCMGAGNTECDTSWSYYFESDTNLPGGELDTVTNALQTILASQQTLHWWGEDKDGEVIGYYYRWNTDTAWTFTTEESEEFVIPIRKELDVFSFAVASVDDDSLVDETPAIISMPIQNSPPVIDFRFRSNPIVLDPNVTEQTFPVRTFVWDVSDADGNETIDSIFYALDDTSESDWKPLDAAAFASVVLTNLVPGPHTFFLKARDVAGAESPVVQYPDTLDETTPNRWEVIPIVGDFLIVDDFHQDSGNKALNWYRSIFDTIPGIGPNGYSVWEIGSQLPFSDGDVATTLLFFSNIFWYTGYTGIETYHNASNAINRFLLNGGNLFINITEFKDETFIWFPIDTSTVINPTGRLLSGASFESQISPSLDLATSLLIGVRLKAFDLYDIGQFNTVDGPTYEVLYRLKLPGDTDSWTGQPVVAAEYDHRSPTTPDAGQVILMSVPMHNGGSAILEGSGSAGKLISWVYRTRFTQ